MAASDPTLRGSWTAHAPAPRFGHSLVAVSESKMLLFGGCSGGKVFLGDAHEYDCEERRWTALSCGALAPRGRFLHSAAAYRGRVYIFGGRNEQGDLAELLVFEAGSGFRAASPWGQAPPASSGHSCAVLRSKMYVWGGALGGDVFELCLKSEKWTRMRAASAAPRCEGQPAVTVRRDLLVFAGLLSLLHRFHVDTMTWTQHSVAGVTPGARKNYTLSLVGPHALALFGGTNPNGIAVRDMWLFDLRSLQWESQDLEGSAPCARSMHAACVAGRRLVLFGGVDTDNAQQSVFNDVHTLVLASPAAAAAAAAPTTLGLGLDAKDEMPPSPQPGRVVAPPFGAAVAGCSCAVDAASARRLCQLREERFAALARALADLEESIEGRSTDERKASALGDAAAAAAASAPGAAGGADTTVTLNVGGEQFRTSLHTLNARENKLAAFFRYGPRLPRGAPLFVDRDPGAFRHVLNFLRDGDVVVPESPQARRELILEAEYFGIDELARKVENA
jgi:N-acetylneuraminic acid mutarotase